MTISANIVGVTFLVGCASFAVPACAEVQSASGAGFVVGGSQTFSATSPEQVWGDLVAPQFWWSPDHSWSGDAANFSLNPVAGGCFCEALPGADQSRAAGSNEHMRIVQARPGAMLVMRGSLGPLQGEALTGVLTITLEPGLDHSATVLRWTYVVGGYARFPLDQVAAVVDGVLAQQMQRLHAYSTAMR